MMMEFKFDGKKLKESGYSAKSCFESIDEFLNREGIYATKQGVYIADESIAFIPFAKLRAYLPRTKWFMNVIDKWYWFDDEHNLDYSDDGYNCLKNLIKNGV